MSTITTTMTVQKEASSSTTTTYQPTRSRQGHRSWMRRRTKSTLLFLLLLVLLIGFVRLVEILPTRTATEQVPVPEDKTSRITLDPQASSPVASSLTHSRKASNSNNKLSSPSSTRLPVLSSTPHNSYNCSCWTLPPAPVQCCHRAIVTAHKFGTFLAQDLLHSSRLKGRWDHSDDATNYKIFTCHSMDCIPPPLVVSSNHPQSAVLTSAATDTTVVKDYRHVAILRNPLEAMVSGYLYHQTGRECTLDYYGAPWRKDLLRDVEQYVKFDHAVTTTMYHPAGVNQKLSKNGSSLVVLPPAANQRSLCEYLTQESEEHGIRVYVEYAWNKWYQNLRYYWSAVHANPPIRTLFVCLEDLERVLSMTTKASTTPHAVVRQSMLDWLYPGTSHGNESFASANVPEASNTRLSLLRKNGHATPRDPATRQRLRNFVELLDQTLLHNQLKQLESIFQCGMDG